MSWLLILLQTITAPAAPALDVATLEAQALTRHPAIRRAAADVFARYEGARAMAEAYRVDVLPRLEQAYAMHLAKYRDMVAPYPAVLQAQRTLFQMTEQYLVALDGAWMAASALRSALPVR